MSLEVVLSRRAVKQPKPNVLSAGDCGPCCFAGLIGETSVPYIYDTYGRHTRNEKWPKLSAFCYDDMVGALNDAQAAGLIDQIGPAAPLWIDGAHPTLCAFGITAENQTIEWFAYLVMALQAGYYGLTIVDHFGRGVNGGGTNHWVMLCGARERSEHHPSVEGSMEHWRIHQEILVSCSATNPDGYWIDAIDFLRDMGGFKVLTARPS